MYLMRLFKLGPPPTNVSPIDPSDLHHPFHIPYVLVCSTGPHAIEPPDFSAVESPPQEMFFLGQNDHFISAPPHQLGEQNRLPVERRDDDLDVHDQSLSLTAKAMMNRQSAKENSSPMTAKPPRITKKYARLCTKPLPILTVLVELAAVVHPHTRTPATDQPF